VYLDRLSGRERREALRQMADRRDEVYARRAANVEALNGGQGSVSA
jgi:peptide deformylase